MRFLLIICSLAFSQILFGENPYCEYTSEEFVQLSNFNADIDLSKVDVELIEAGVFYLTNIYRENKGAMALNYNEQLGDAAYLHSQQMVKYNFFNHVNRKNRSLSTLDKRVTYAGYENFETVAENIFYGFIDLSDIGTYRELCQFIVDNFIASKGHRLNMLQNDVADNGNGIYFESKSKKGFWHFYFTQDFGSQF